MLEELLSAIKSEKQELEVIIEFSQDFKIKSIVNETSRKMDRCKRIHDLLMKRMEEDKCSMWNKIEDELLARGLIESKDVPLSVNMERQRIYRRVT